MVKTSTLLFRASTLLFGGALILGSASNVQAQRIALVEQVTSASCGPCAAANPAFDALLNNNLHQVAVIKYQRGGGTYVDPMWDFNPSETDSRVTGFYQTFHFPNVWINGTDIGSPTLVNQQTLDDAASAPEKFEIDLSYELNSAQDELTVSATFTSLVELQDGDDVLNRAYVAVIEKEVLYDNPPGFNGETEFHWVMRKMFPGSGGTLIGQQMIGDQHTADYTYSIDLNEIDPEKLEVLAWVQKGTSKEVYQAAFSRPSTVGISTNELEQNVKVYPTLASETINIVANDLQGQNYEVEVYDALGRLVQRLNPTDTQAEISVAGWTNGLYVAKITVGEQQVSKKFVVSH